MHPFDSFPYDQSFYAQSDPSVLLLYYVEGVQPVIKIESPHLFDFINSFEDAGLCRNEISNNRPRNCSLFVHKENMETWIWNNNPIDDNLNQIIVFCHFDHERNHFRDWSRRYTSRPLTIIRCDELPRELLVFGMNYLNNLAALFQNNAPVHQRLRQQQRRLCVALINLL